MTERFALDIAVFRPVAEALAIGMLVGVERYRDRGPEGEGVAGVRTFALLGLLGGICGLLVQPLFTLVTFAALAALLWAGFQRRPPQYAGLTTEVAALLVFWLGYLLHSYEVLAISTGIVLTILLASKTALHEFVEKRVSEGEFYDTLKFLVVVFVVFPLLPDRDLGPFGFFNPTRVWLMVVLVSTVSYSAYILMRWLGSSRGLEVGALVGGLVSTTAVTMSLASRARRAPQFSRLCGVVGVMANAVQFPRLLLLIWVVDRNLGAFLAIPLAGMGAVGLAGAWALSRVRRPAAESPGVDLSLENPYSLTPALKFGTFFVGVFLVSKAATAWLGERGIYLASALAGTGDRKSVV
jgi:uncharacterized membrane protein (DUF4010 family)